MVIAQRIALALSGHPRLGAEGLRHNHRTDVLSNDGNEFGQASSGENQFVSQRGRLALCLPSRADCCWMVVIGLLGLGVRLAYATQYTSHSLGRLLWVDEIIYWERARDILWGKWLPEQPFYQDPLIPYLLAGLMKLVGSETAPLRIALVCLGSLTPVATYWAGYRGFGRAEAVISGLILAFYGPLVFTDGQIEKEGPARSSARWRSLQRFTQVARGTVPSWRDWPACSGVP